MKKLMMTLAAVLAASTVFGAFKYETTLSVPGYTGEETLENFPLLVRISAAKISGFAYDKCQADGKDLVFTSADGKTVYPHEVDEWNVGGESLVWVKIPELKSGTTFKMKFGDATLAAAPAYTANGAVWSAAGFAAVYHLNETVGAKSVNFPAKDSSKFGVAAQAKKGSSGNVAQIDTVASGKIGRARTLNSTAQYTGNALIANSFPTHRVGTQFAVSGWLYVTSGNGGQVIFSRKNTTGDADGWMVTIGNSNQIYLYGASNTAVGCPVGVNFTSVPGGWFHLTVVYDGNKATVYFQGESKGTKTVPAAPIDNARAFTVGSVASVNTTALSGNQDEIRYHEGLLSAAWVNADYDSQVDVDYVTASAVSEPALADTLFVRSTSAYQQGTVSPAYGVNSVSAGPVTCTAPASPVVVADDENYTYSGWTLTQTTAAGVARTTTGAGTTCEYTHVAGEADDLVWTMNRCFRVTATSSDESLGTVSGSGFVGEGETATLTALPKAGMEFKRWTSAQVASADAQTNPLSVKICEPFTAEASFCVQRYTWIGTAGGLYWKDAKNWKDITGDGTGDVPPKDGTATVVLPHYKNGYHINVDSGVNIYGIYLKASAEDNGTSGNAVSLNGGSLTLGAGGVEADDSQFAVGLKINSPLTLSASQTWMNKSSDTAIDNAVNNNGFAINGKLIAAQDVVLTVSGTMPFFPNANNTSEFFGKIKTNCRVKPSSNSFLTHAELPTQLEVYATDEPYPSIKNDKITFDQAANGKEIKITAPVRLDLAENNRLMKMQLQVSASIQSNRWFYNWTGPISGAFKDKMLSFGNVMESSSQHFSKHPRKQRNYLSGDNSGLATTGNPSVCFPNGVITIGHANALGAGNVLGAYFGTGDTAGYFKGLTVTNNITVASALAINGTQPTLLGMLDPGEGTFSGNFTGNQLGSVFLYAVPDATVHFSGAFTMNSSNNYSLEAIGGGEVDLEGDNSKVNQKPLNVRSAKVVLGHANAAGTKPVNLGGVVPEKITVRAVRDRGFGCCGSGAGEVKYAMTKTDNANNCFTFTDNGFVIDGVALNVGDTFLYVNDVADGVASRVFKYVSKGRIEGEFLNYAAGLKIYVEAGDEYGGRTFMLEAAGISASTATVRGSGNPVQDVTDPDVALLAKNGITVANDINVTDNLSAGLSSIGVADASSVTFTGNVTLNRAVTFCAAAGGTATFTGTIADSGETKNAVGVNGAGTVVLPTLDWTDRVLDLRHVDDAALEASGVRSVTLLRAEGVGQATVLMPTKPMRWSLSVRGNSVRASRGGFTLVVR